LSKIKQDIAFIFQGKETENLFSDLDASIFFDDWI